MPSKRVRSVWARRALSSFLITSIMAVTVGVPCWWLTFGALTSLEIPRERPGAGDAHG